MYFILTQFLPQVRTAQIHYRHIPQGFWVFFLFIWVLRLVKFISLIVSPINRKVGRKQEIPEKNHLTTIKQNFARLTCDPSWA